MSFYDILHICDHQHSSHILLHHNSIYIMNWDSASWHQPPPLSLYTMEYWLCNPPSLLFFFLKEKGDKSSVPITYQAKISNVRFTDSNKFSKKSHTLRHHLFFSIKVHYLNRAFRTENITKTPHQEKTEKSIATKFIVQISVWRVIHKSTAVWTGY